MTSPIRRFRALKGWSLEQLAEKAGLSRSYLNELELGRKTMNARRQEQIARALGVRPIDLMEGGPHTEVDGFAESHLANWLPPEPDPTAAAPAMAEILRTLAPRTRVPATMMMTTSLHSFGLLAGDLVILDISRRTDPESGQLVVLNLIDEERATGTTVVRRHLPPVYLDADGQPELIESARGSVRGVVVGSIRAPQMTARGTPA